VTKLLSGGCLCGGAKFRITGELFMAVNCHCSMCRKAHGAAFRSGALVRADQFSWVRGEELVADYRSSPGMHRMFCRNCGSPLIARSDAHAGILGVSLGTLDDDPGIRPAAHWNVASKASWFDITDNLPQHRSTPAKS
jgi:hypothetical protein